MRLNNFCEKCQEMLKCTWIHKNKARNMFDEDLFRAYVPVRPGDSESPYSSEDTNSLVKLKHYSVKGLRHSAEKGCQLCWLFERHYSSSVQNVQNRKRDEQIQKAMYPLIVRGKNGLNLFLVAPYSRCSLFFFPSPLPDDTDPHVSTGERSDPNEGVKPLARDHTSKFSLITVDAIKNWLHDCHINHSACRKWTAIGAGASCSKLGPSRLLAITARDEPTVRLVEAASLAENFSYVTLSHCWGEEILVQRLTTHNIQRFTNGFPVSELPATFQDAVTATISIGREFLWIDALCIIQDSEEDWSREAPRMASVYSQGYVNLAATASRDPSGGLFCQRPTFDTDIHQLHVEWSGFDGIAKDMNVIRDTWMESIERAPLNRRGWVLQERLMSPRTINFAGDQVWWDCKEVFCSERQSHLAEPRRGVYMALEKGLFANIAARFSGLGMSRASDRLVALSGLARFFAHLRGYDPTDYLAGLWRTEFPRNLTWYGAWRSTDTQTYNVPSWSWASVQSRLTGLTWESEDDNLIAEFIEGQVKTQSQDPFGIVLGGHLRCVGTLQSIKISVSTVLSVSLGRSLEMPISDGFPDEETVRLSSEEEVFVFFDRVTNDIASALQTSWVFPIFWHDESPPSGKKFPNYKFYPRRTRGLLLQPIEGRSGFFKRVGVIIVDQHRDRWNEEHWTSCMLEEGMYTRDAGSGRYEFVIE